MSAFRNATLKHLPKAALGLSVAGILGIPIGLSADMEWVVLPAVISLMVGVLLGLVYGLVHASAAAQVIRWCMVLYVVAVVFKFLRYPGAAPMLVFAFGVPMVLFLVGTLALPFRYKGNLFLILIGGLSGLLLIAGYFASLGKMMYWHNADQLFNWFAPGYVLVTIVLLIGIQLTDFVQWDPAPRRFLTNNILLPWAFLFLVGGSILLMPKQFFNLIGSELDWGMVKEEQHEDL